MITHLKLARLSNEIYNNPKHFKWDNYWQHDDVVVGHLKVCNEDIIVFRGTDNVKDALRDLSFWPKKHLKLGYCFDGFLTGLDDVFEETKAVVGENVYITGHSLGGARARLLAALYIINSLPVKELCVFGSPKPAYKKVAQIIQNSDTKHISYRHSADLIPKQPPTLWPFLRYIHTEQWIELQGDAASSEFKDVEDHMMVRYIKALKELEKDSHVST
jgi:hypothetical protein